MTLVLHKSPQVFNIEIKLEYPILLGYAVIMVKKVLISAFLFGIVCAATYFLMRLWIKRPQPGVDLLDPIVELTEKSINPFKKLAGNTIGRFSAQKEFFGDEINILIIGTDSSANRRADGQLGFNTDTMILLSMNVKTDRILLTSVPRDLWINGNKINALHIVYGYDTLKDAFEQITGQTIDGYIRTDFDGFKWMVDAFGGVPINVERTFTDVSFPNNTDTGVMPVTFTEGSEVMDGDRALIFARSRKGTNGEGSDLMRAKRQHLLLQGMADAVSQPNSQFWPMDIEKFYQAVTQHMETSLSVDDVYYLWDFYKDREKYQVESFVIGSEYIYHPGLYPESDYHAWVFIPIDDSFEQLHKDIEAKLNADNAQNQTETLNQD